MIPLNYVRIVETPAAAAAQIKQAPSEKSSLPEVTETESKKPEDKKVRRRVSSRRLSLSAGDLDQVALVAAVAKTSGGMEMSIDPANSSSQTTKSVKSMEEISAFDAELRRVADDDGERALSRLSALKGEVVATALANQDADGLQAWLQALVDTPALRALAIAFARGGRVSGDAKLEAVPASGVSEEKSHSNVDNSTGKMVRAIARFKFDPTSESELALAQGDVVSVDIEAVVGEDPDELIRRVSTDGWLLGKCERTSHVGYFPASYVTASVEKAPHSVEVSRKPMPKNPPASRESRPVSMRSLEAFDALTIAGLAVERAAGTQKKGPEAKTGDLVTARCTASAWDGGTGQATPYASTDWDKGDDYLVMVIDDTAVGTDGLHAGLKGLRVGESARVTCSPKLAYGAAGLPPHVAPGCFVIYDVEIIDIESNSLKNTRKGPRDLLVRPAAINEDEDHGEKLGRVVSVRRRYTVDRAMGGPENTRSIPRKAANGPTLPTHPEAIDEN